MELIEGQLFVHLNLGSGAVKNASIKVKIDGWSMASGGTNTEGEDG